MGTVSVGRPRSVHGIKNTLGSPPSATPPRSSNNPGAPARKDGGKGYSPPATPVAESPPKDLSPPPPSGRPSATKSRVTTETAHAQRGATLETPEDPDLRQWAVNLYGKRGLTMELPPNNTHESGQGKTYRAPEGLGAAQWFEDAIRFGPGSSRASSGKALPSTPTGRDSGTTSPAGPSVHGLALQCRTVSLQAVAQLQVQGEWTQAVKDILPETRTKCPMCTLLAKPANHSPARCTTAHLDMGAQMRFRRDPANEWGYGQACYYCHLPQDFCRRRNEVKGCDLSQYKDLVRGLLMLMSAYPDMHALGSDTAALFEEGYELPPPGGPLQMTAEWRTTVYFKGMPMYRAFQAIAALLFLFDGRL
ncbi:unnamed protein product [Tilletia controversa]|nr:unnamed protein product [Tilletia controversa]